jgi:hypothetical protein
MSEGSRWDTGILRSDAAVACLCCIGLRSPLLKCRLALAAAGRYRVHLSIYSFRPG